MEADDDPVPGLGIAWKALDPLVSLLEVVDAIELLGELDVLGIRLSFGHG